MDLDKLQEAMADQKTGELFANRKKVLEAIGKQEGLLSKLRADLAEVEAQITDALGANEQPAAERKQMTCSHCGAKGHNKKGCPQLKEG